MVAVTIPKQISRASPEQLRQVYKEAFEYKRDHIASIQSRPPFDDAAHRLYNSAYSKIFSIIAHTGTSPTASPLWEDVLTDPSINDEERALLAYLGQFHDWSTCNDNEWEQAAASCKTDGNISAGSAFGTPAGRPPIAPRFVANFLDNAGLEDNDLNRRAVLTTAAAAYREACLDANAALDEATDSAAFGVPASLKAMLEHGPETPAPPASAIVATPVSNEPKASSALGEHDLSAASAPTQPDVSGLVDLRMSELCKLAIDENERDGSWQHSARRNAKVITNIFIAENGDLRMSEIERQHLLNLDRRLKLMPTVWGKSREDRQGGLAAVFARGEQLAAIWANDPVAAEQNGIAKVGLSAPTYNRHINTLKQLFTFAGGLEDGDGRPTHLAPKPSFQKLHQKDKRKKNMRKPTPAHDEVRTLVSGPIYKGSASLTDRFVPGDLVFHDGAYWVPLLIILYGARSNEFCQMPLANVITDAETPFFRICETTHQSIKTSSSGRELPIAPKLIELGFIDYVRALREQREFRLFPEFNRTNVPARKVFRDTVFVPLREHHFPNGTSNILDGKEIDTQSFRKFAATHLRKAEPKISRSIRQAFFGHQLGTTLEDTYEDSFTPDELLPCVERMQTLIDHVEKFPLRLRPDAEA